MMLKNFKFYKVLLSVLLVPFFVGGCCLFTPTANAASHTSHQTIMDSSDSLCGRDHSTESCPSNEKHEIVATIQSPEGQNPSGSQGDSPSIASGSVDFRLTQEISLKIANLNQEIYILKMRWPAQLPRSHLS